MKCFPLLLVCSFLIACQSKLQKQLNQADALTIHFYRDARADSVIKIVRTTSKDAIENLTTFIENKESPVPATCGHDGDIIFYRGEQVLQVIDFNILQLNCRHFEMQINGKPVRTPMNNEAADFLLALWAGKKTF